MVVDDTTVATTPTRNNVNHENLIQDENLNRINPPQEVTPVQTAQDKENEKLKNQIAEMAKQAEKMSTLNDQYRQRNANLEEAIREEKKRA
jgi:hypothetical protein